ncbi:uncharacterized protein LOC110987533 isoform X2 [Acanthaster planci]|uniref:Uncharacterized protein LOC110987533 isoform X2 n=1 Tax=Acanthaster planci TaxID=133434 RepID=A0A8B7ZRF7_ACAPL|nr:uncharacterized protein LOC110987533 isoform X2 [Acanthaster planci]
MDLNPDADLAVRKKKKKKKKRKHAETPADYAWIKTEPETEWLSVQSQNLDFGTIDNNRTLGAPKETRKKKKKVKSEDPVENVPSVDAEMVCDFGISDSTDHSDEAKQILKKKRKRKRKRSILQEAQSEETSSIAGDSQQEVQDGVEDCPLSFRAEPQSHKCKKNKKCKVQEQPSPGTLTADVAESQHIMPAVSEATKEKVADKSRKKKKHKAKDHLDSPMSTDADGDQTSGKITVTDTTEDDARHKKRKRKAQDKLNELHYEEPQGLADANCKNQDDLVSEGVGYPVRIKKGKRKKKDLDEHLQTGGSAESQISPNTVDMQEKLSSQEEDPKPRKRKKKSTGWNNGNDDPICLQSSEIEIGQSGCSKAPAADRLLEAKASVFAGKMGWSSAAEEEDESWIQDLPFYVGTSTCTSLRRKPIQKEGVVLKKGYWKGHEDKILRENIENFCKKYGIDDVKKVTHPHLFEEKQALLCLIQQKKFYLKMCK